MNLIEIKQLEKRYERFHLQASLAVGESETLALVGPNGSGKTTLIYSLLNVVRRDGGEVRFFGRDLDKNEVSIKTQLGVFFEESRLFEDLRVTHLLRLYSRFYPCWDWEYAEALLDRFEVDRALKFKKLSKGMRAKVALTLAFATRPRALILDEPTSGLDPRMRRMFVEVVREAKERFSPSIMLTSHIMRDIEDLADTVAFIEKGRIKLVAAREALNSWRIVEGVCNGKVPSEAKAWRLEPVAGRTRFQFLTDRYGEQLLAQLNAQRATVTHIWAPDLEEIYDWIMNPRGSLKT